MQLYEIMTANPEIIQPDSGLREAARLMRDLDVGAIPVCDGDRLRGMVTDRDIVVRAIAEGRDPKATPVEEVMTSGIIYCFEDQNEEEAAAVMEQHQLRRLPILNRDKRLTGIVSIGDLSVKARRDRLSGDTLEGVSQPARPNRGVESK